MPHLAGNCGKVRQGTKVQGLGDPQALGGAPWVEDGLREGLQRLHVSGLGNQGPGGRGVARRGPGALRGPAVLGPGDKKLTTGLRWLRWCEKMAAKHGAAHEGSRPCISASGAVQGSAGTKVTGMPPWCFHSPQGARPPFLAGRWQKWPHVSTPSTGLDVGLGVPKTLSHTVPVTCPSWCAHSRDGPQEPCTPAVHGDPARPQSMSN